MALWLWRSLRLNHSLASLQTSICQQLCCDWYQPSRENQIHAADFMPMQELTWMCNVTRTHTHTHTGSLNRHMPHHDTVDPQHEKLSVILLGVIALVSLCNLLQLEYNRFTWHVSLNTLSGSYTNTPDLRSSFLSWSWMLYLLNKVTG